MSEGVDVDEEEFPVRHASLLLPNHSERDIHNQGILPIERVCYAWIIITDLLTTSLGPL